MHGTSTAPRRSSDGLSPRLRLALAATLALTAISVLAYRTHRVFTGRPAEVRLRLGDDAPLDSPPPLPANDLDTLRERLRPLDALRADAEARSTDPAAWFALGRAAYQAGDIRTAQHTFARLLRLRPDSPPTVYDLLGRCDLMLALYAEAESAYRSMLARAPGEALAYVGLARSLSALQQPLQSAAALQQARHRVAVDDARGHRVLSEEFDRMGQLPEAMAEAEAALAAAPNDVETQVTAAALLFKMRRFGEAGPRLEGMVAAHPDSVHARRILAAMLDNPLFPQRNRSLAEHHYLEVLQRSPRDTDTCAKLGQMYQEQGRYRQAAYIYTCLLTTQPDSAAARLQLAHAYRSLGDAARSQEQIGIAERLLARDRREAALLTRRDRHPADPKAHLALGRHYVDAGQFSRALIEYQSAAALDPGSSAARQSLTDLWQRLGLAATTVRRP